MESAIEIMLRQAGGVSLLIHQSKIGSETQQPLVNSIPQKRIYHIDLGRHQRADDLGITASNELISAFIQQPAQLVKPGWNNA
jgi:hypothetical protein